MVAIADVVFDYLTWVFVMQLYLIYCDVSSETNSLAFEIEAAADGKINAINITSKKANELLYQVFPNGWKYHPYLVKVNQDIIAASTGYEMFVQLKGLLGLQKGWQVYSIAQRYGVKLQNRVRKFPRRRGFRN
jgi:hypothetical protein